ncbi:hypothetical protein ACH5RR_037143 [Cinchona calisaya]|uniref:Aminotransferase-like plant mobile domain-containing protein n=1 Tax=Cinchona calisaya TaxID=153742 RepID=A0ABD2Y5A2_9GENT
MQIKDSETPEQCLQLLDGKRGSSAHDLSLHTLPPAIGDLAIKIDPLATSSHLPEWSTKSAKGVIGPSSSLISKEVHVLLSHNHDGEQSTNKFLLPFARTNLDKTAWDAPSSNFGETCYTTCYWEWAEDVLSGHKKVLLDAKIYDAIHASLFTYDYCDNTLHAFLELWCHTTNTLHSSTGELSISLWDLRKLGGLPIHVTFYDEVVPSADELCGTSVDGKSRLPASCIHLFSAFHKLTKRTKDVRIVDWIQFWFKGQSRYQQPPLRVSGRRISSKPRTTHNPSGIIDNDYAFKINNKAEQFLDLGVDETSRDETYLAAFLSCWICKFLLPRHKIGHIRPSVFKVASLMACGQKFSLAVPVLSSIYNGLNEVVHSSKLRESTAVFPIHYLYAWIAHYFDAYHMHGKYNYGALMTKFGGEKMAKFFTADEARSLLLKMNPSILPSLCLAQEKNCVLVDNGDLSSSWIDYFIITRSCYLTLRLNNVHIVEPYNPCRFSRQFGFCQDVPYDLIEKLPPYSLVDIMQLWESSTRVATQSKITLPAQKVSFFVAKDYHHWWSSRSNEAPKHTIKINLKKRKSIESCAHLASRSDVAIHSSHEHKSTKRSSS